MDNTRELTFGEKAVGLTFNPANDPTVDKLKKLYAEVIDTIHDLKTPSDSYMKNELIRQSIFNAIGAQMDSVKAVTFRD